MKSGPVLRHLPVVCMIVLVAATSPRADGQIEIEQPAKQSLITTSTIFVGGKLVGKSRDIGVTVNGVRGDIDLEHAGSKQDPFRWFAEIGAIPGTVRIKARLVRSGDAIDNADHGNDDDEGPASVVHVVCAPPEAPTILRALPANGIVPLSVSFSIQTDLDLSGVTRFEIDYQGDGTYDYVSTTIPETSSFTYTSTGVHRPVARITSSDGSTVTAQTGVVGQTFRTLDTLLRRTWTTLVDAMARGDVAGALSSFAAGTTRDKYEPVLQLIRPSLREFATGVRDLRPLWIGGDTAHYLLVRVENGRDVGYHVYFARDASGLWKIVQM